MMEIPESDIYFIRHWLEQLNRSGNSECLQQQARDGRKGREGKKEEEMIQLAR